MIIGKATVNLKEAKKYFNSENGLKEMFDFLKEREKGFINHLVKYIDLDKVPNEWQVLLSHWMIEKRYRNFSEFRAKQFANYLKNSNDI